MPHFSPVNFRQWILSCALGEFIGIAIAAAITVLHFRLLGEPVTLADKIITMFIMLLAGAIEGALVAYFQWRVLRNFLPDLTLSRWQVVTIAAALTGWFLGMLPILMSGETSQGAAPAFDPPLWLVSLTAAGVGLVFGAIFGWFQWLELRKHLSGAAKWIWANTWGWTLGITWVYMAATLPDATTPIGITITLGAISGVLMGVSVGAVTGLYLKKILRQTPINQ